MNVLFPRKDVKFTVFLEIDQKLTVLVRIHRRGRPGERGTSLVNNQFSARIPIATAVSLRRLYYRRELKLTQ